MSEDETENEGCHVRHTHEALKNTAWCGAKLTSLDWAFTDVDHLLYHIARDGGVPWCEACCHTIESVASGAWAASGAQLFENGGAAADIIKQQLGSAVMAPPAEAWTRTPPTTPGWYWALSKWSRGDPEPEAVLVEQRAGGLMAVIVDDDRPHALTDWRFWIGPLEPPPLPNG